MATIAAARQVCYDRTRASGPWIIGPWLVACLIGLAGCSYKASVYGLRPLYPPVRMGAMFSGQNGQLEYPVVDFTHVALKWQAFAALPTEVGQPSGPTNITYDLRIWEAHNGSPGKVVYERRALPVPQHELERPLTPNTRYFWSVRARFEINGETRLGDWSRSLHPYSPVQRADLPGEIPYANYFRFVTSDY